MEQQQTTAVESEAGLKEEMKTESILRQVTHSAVILTADLLDPCKTNPPPMTASSGHNGTRVKNEAEYPTLRRFCLMRQDIVEPLLVFCNHAIRMRDTRSCTVAVRLFISLIPEFRPIEGPPTTLVNPDDGATAEQRNKAWQEPPNAAPAIREFISRDVLKACVTSFNEPYFVEVQKELASLIAAIVVHYGALTTTPRDMLLSLPNINVDELNRLTPYIAKPGSHTRQQRAIVLELLKELKGLVEEQEADT
ncbi:hypothetical protein CDD82_823 [Ophiocordyceps australis]|uniref:Exportin-5 C-terminal domain-containing protein n=1 Tax=Ophiocordyceps australis TaxID=1399860 RepID=A0A2C5YM77_9HYPO|nr:hypothetical protein CDD82_823 [Ophiocordyceps australis]